jgi:thiol-disulfide isomerase/thioredoxin
LTLRDARGRARRLDDYRGQVVLVNFWATWCPPCRAEMPDLVKLQREYGRSGLRVIGVTYPDDDRRAARALIRRLKVNYPILWGSPRAVQAFEIGEALPVTIVIDRRGLIRERITGILLPEEFTQKIAPLLREAR